MGIRIPEFELKFQDLGFGYELYTQVFPESLDIDVFSGFEEPKDTKHGGLHVLK